jgi:16S rRNA (uracil1498-N3)-methyltransferase
MEMYGNLARIYTAVDLTPGAAVPLNESQAHYFRNVLRRDKGDFIRVFNGRDGEWRAEIIALGKKNGIAKLSEKIRDQPALRNEIHLLFAPIKKDRMFFLIEKSVELGVTHLHPVKTARTDSRMYNHDKSFIHVIEAAEQCERMDIPVLSPMVSLTEKIRVWRGPPVLWCHERAGAEILPDLKGADCAFLIGPEGGFDETEAIFLSAQMNVKPVSLGESILRAETAAIFCIARAR